MSQEGDRERVGAWFPAREIKSAERHKERFAGDNTDAPGKLLLLVNLTKGGHTVLHLLGGFDPDDGRMKHIETTTTTTTTAAAAAAAAAITKQSKAKDTRCRIARKTASN